MSWLAQEVRDGKIRWVLPDNAGGGGLRNDGRPGSNAAMTAVAQACSPVSADGVTLYDCQGAALAG